MKLFKFFIFNKLKAPKQETKKQRNNRATSLKSKLVILTFKFLGIFISIHFSSTLKNHKKRIFAHTKQ